MVHRGKPQKYFQHPETFTFNDEADAIYIGVWILFVKPAGTPYLDVFICSLVEITNRPREDFASL